MNKVFLLIQIVVCICVASGCVSTTDPSEKPIVQMVARDLAFKAEVDVKNNQITLPLEKYLLSTRESGKEFSANVLMTHLCMAENGQPAFWVDPGEPSSQETYRYSRWSKKNAEMHGYAVVPDSSSKMRDAETVWVNQNQTALNSIEYALVLEECSSSDTHIPILARSVDNSLPNEVVMMQFQSYDLMLETPEADAVFSEWELCITAAGLERDLAVSPFAIKGVSFDEPDENSIKAAVADVACKEKTNFIQRLADIEASFQGPVVKKYEAELVAHRAKLDEIMPNVYDYLDKNTAKGEALWKP